MCGKMQYLLSTTELRSTNVRRLWYRLSRNSNLFGSRRGAAAATQSDIIALTQELQLFVKFKPFRNAKIAL